MVVIPHITEPGSVTPDPGSLGGRLLFQRTSFKDLHHLTQHL